MRTSIRNVIATRKLREIAPDGRTVLVRIGKPRKVSASEWECAFHISNIGMDEIQFGHGIDGVQALIQAIEGSRVFLEKSGKRFPVIRNKVKLKTMKKITLIFVVCAGSFMLSALRQESFGQAPRKVILEDYTGAWCGFCPSAGTEMEK